MFLILAIIIVMALLAIGLDMVLAVGFIIGWWIVLPIIALIFMIAAILRRIFTGGDGTGV